MAVLRSRRGTARGNDGTREGEGTEVLMDEIVKMDGAVRRRGAQMYHETLFVFRGAVAVNGPSPWPAARPSDTNLWR